MSGGEQQRTSIARALVNRPTILLGDEPTGNLDTKTSETIIDLFREVNETRGVTTLLITHDMAVARKTRRIIRIRDGLVEGDEPNAPILGSPAVSA
jgi:ABC-type lipoprotein export system ATPase subunit